MGTKQGLILAGFGLSATPKTVPEPRSDLEILVGMGIIGVGMICRRHSRSLTSKHKISDPISLS